ncbi:hypothetical protein M9H77_31666 [Catharanthus roseus]|uniref:Uncharacterized protein n=1 Tax=Catharanthus roseus TaxID=4058 RepID=A0ACC0A2T4_CATRO|nr:hypothetical protein M9H77_31666 [Catharanthus roseus]
MDPNLWRVLMTMRVFSFYKEYQMFNFTLYSMNSDNEIGYLWTIRPNISKEGIHVLVEFEPIQSQTFSELQHTNVSTEEDHPNIPQHVTIIIHMVSDEPSMLYPSVQKDDNDNDGADEDYEVSSESDDIIMIIMRKMTVAFLNAPYDYTQSGIFLDMGSGLLDWNEIMVDIQLGLRFVDKIQAISTVQKWSIRIG